LTRRFQTVVQDRWFRIAFQINRKPLPRVTGPIGKAAYSGPIAGPADRLECADLDPQPYHALVITDRAAVLFRSQILFEV
jgi:hypothetical protein